MRRVRQDGSCSLKINSQTENTLGVSPGQKVECEALKSWLGMSVYGAGADLGLSPLQAGARRAQPAWEGAVPHPQVITHLVS